MPHAFHEKTRRGVSSKVSLRKARGWCRDQREKEREREEEQEQTGEEKDSQGKSPFVPLEVQTLQRGTGAAAFFGCRRRSIKRAGVRKRERERGHTFKSKHSNRTPLSSFFCHTRSLRRAKRQREHRTNDPNSVPATMLSAVKDSITEKRKGESLEALLERSSPTLCSSCATAATA